MDRPTLYIETSIVSYLASDLSRHPVSLRNQQLTHAWWNTRRHEYALYTSRAVLDEIERGDPVMAARRMTLLATIPVMELKDPELLLARTLQQQIPLPARAKDDALHIAAAATHGIGYLLTWDQKHIANPRLEARVGRILLAHGYVPPVLATPIDLMENA
ncbi:MAG TPA: type II toxin-antitoxin system VapC family toxin [Longimicrobium sp.]|nr:type II toxin-antitoxin system VapC family toxin [Longimicrobium sp.]